MSNVTSKQNIEELVVYYRYLARTNPAQYTEYTQLADQLERGDTTWLLQ